MSSTGHGQDRSPTSSRRSSRVSLRKVILRKGFFLVGITVAMVVVMFVHFRRDEDIIVRSPRIDILQFNIMDVHGIYNNLRTNYTKLGDPIKVRAIRSNDKVLNSTKIGNKTEIVEALFNERDINTTTPADYMLGGTGNDFRHTQTLDPKFELFGLTTPIPNVSSTTESVIAGIVSRISVLAIYTKTVADGSPSLKNPVEQSKVIKKLSDQMQTVAKEAGLVMESRDLSMARKEGMIIELSQKCDTILEKFHNVTGSELDEFDRGYIEEND